MDLPSTKYNIICFSNQLWDFPNWTNKKHVMTRLAKRGHKVLFVDPPINVGRVFGRQISRGFWGPMRLLSRIKKDSTGAYIFTPLNIIPSGPLTSKRHANKIKRIAAKKFDPNLKTLLWVYHVEIKGIEHYLETLKYDFLIYDCVDNYESFPTHDTEEKKEWVRNQEKYLAEKANIVFATTPLLVEKLKKYNTNAFFTPNVGDYEKFVKSKSLKDSLPPNLKSISRPRIGFAGALDSYKFDIDLMKKIAKEHQEFSFILIGQFALKDTKAGEDAVGLSGLENVHLLGTIPYEDLEKYYAGFDAYIIPYKLNEYTVGGCFPVKFHDALAAGLPTIVTDLPAYAPFKDVCYVSKNYNQFSRNIEIALEEDNDSKVKERQTIAEKNSWENKVDKMLFYISEFIPKKEVLISE